MKITTHPKALTAIALALTLSACSGGGGGHDGGPVEYDTPIQPINGLTQAMLAQTDATTDREITFTNAVGVNATPTERNNGILASLFGQITFNTGTSDENREQVAYRFDTNQDGSFSQDPNAPIQDNISSARMNEATQNTTNELDAAAIRSDTMQIGDQNILRTINETSYDDLTIVYLPSPESRDVYAGGFVRHGGQTGYHAVFGRRTTGAEIAAIEDRARDTTDGRVSYSGVAGASVTHVDGSVMQSGYYQGDRASGWVDFTTREVHTEATLQRERRDAVPFTDTIEYSSTGQYDANGSISGAPATFTINGTQTVAGEMNGTLFGPEANTLGGTFNTNGYADGAIGGHLLMNQDAGR